MYWASEKAATAKQPDAAIFLPRLRNMTHQLSELVLYVPAHPPPPPPPPLPSPLKWRGPERYSLLPLSR